MLKKLGILVGGPSGVGKTTLCWKLRHSLHGPYNVDVGYVYADLFSSLVYPWRADEAQLDVKYSAVLHAVRLLAERYELVLIEDTFRRQSDIDDVAAAMSKSGFHLQTILLTSPKEILLQRNAGRAPPYRLADEDVLGILDTQTSFVWPDPTVIDTDCTTDEILARVLSALPARFPADGTLHA